MTETFHILTGCMGHEGHAGGRKTGHLLKVFWAMRCHAGEDVKLGTF